MLTLTQHCCSEQMKLWRHAFQQDDFGLGGMSETILSAAWLALLGAAQEQPSNSCASKG